MRAILWALLGLSCLACGAPSQPAPTEAQPVQTQAPAAKPSKTEEYIELIKALAKVHTDAKGDCLKLASEASKFEEEHKKELAAVTPKMFQEIDANKDQKFWMRVSMDEIMRARMACKPKEEPKKKK